MALSYETSCKIGDILKREKTDFKDVMKAESELHEYHVANPKDSILQPNFIRNFAWDFDQQFIEENYDTDLFWFAMDIWNSKNLADHIKIYLKMRWNFNG